MRKGNEIFRNIIWAGGINSDSIREITGGWYLLVGKRGFGADSRVISYQARRFCLKMFAK
ncbi:hypothetical protein QNH36_00555 [Mesobacillus sp. AQ2]|uniref:hypothetical protein n=1 Tax=unclassified Mesobacillus TaxID=2675270 RepID=UPI00203D2B89|nr:MULTISPECIES: hypothetical protein [unclassified Mesobacillus]MCM3125714.1 hypothetical protein [Mesobacillus sp. MER 33]MCM3235735.1 hypothetical protein [Mesobacillus sp. MER 48]WHX40712.1 hypothetical protein QNH36_00555 [Mesobacillus sp. AQ2]